MRGADLSQFRTANDRLRVRRELGLSSGPVILSPRSAGNSYNLDTIPLAIPEVVKHFPNVQVAFIWQSASDEQAASLINLAGALNVERNVLFVGKSVTFGQ